MVKPEILTKKELLELFKDVDDDAPITIFVEIGDYMQDGPYTIRVTKGMCPGYEGCSHVGPAPDDEINIVMYPSIHPSSIEV